MQPIKIVKLGEVCEKVSNCNPITDVGNAFFNYVDIASVDKDSKSVIGASKILGVNAPSRARQIIKSDDVLVSTVRPNLNAVAKINGVYHEAVASTGFCVLRPREKDLSATYLYYWVQSKEFVDEMVKRATGANYPAVSDSIIKNSKIPLPDLDTQRHIAAVLDRADALRQKDRQLLSYYEQLPQAVFLEMFGDPVRNEKGWAVVTLEKLIIDGPQNGLYKPAKAYGSGTPILRIDSFYDGSVTDIDALKRVEATDRERQLYRLYSKNIVINRVNSRSHLGKSALIPHLKEVTVFESNMMRIAVDGSRVAPEFLIKMLCQDYVKRQILERAKDAVNQSSINQQDVLSFTVLVPPLALQTEFVQTVEAIEKQKAVAKQQLAASEALFQSLLHEYFGQKA